MDENIRRASTNRYEVHYEAVFVTIGVMDELRLYLFGSPRLLRNGSLVEMDTRKALALAAVLAISGQEIRRETLTALLYPEADPESARAAFRRTLSTLNHALGPGRLDARREAVGLAAGLWVDVLVFRSLLAGQASLSALEQAVVLYQDDFMAGFSLRDSPAFDDWQYQQSEELRRLLLGALDRLADFCAQAGDVESAIRHASRRVELDPLLEEGQRHLMLLYAQAGQRNAALRQYRECVRVLEKELGVAPLEETTALYQEILNGRGERTLPRVSPISGPVVDRHPGGVGEAAHSLAPTAPPLVGREQELAVLRAALRADHPKGVFISMEGEAGVGKTRLADEFLATAQRAGRAVIRAACYEGESALAYGPFIEGLGMALAQPEIALRLESLPVESLAEAARLLPGLAERSHRALPPGLPDGPGAQGRFFEGLRQVFDGLLGGENPGILLLDDLQWADSASLDLLAYLAHRLNGQSCWIVAVWRSREGANAERLHQLQAEQQRAGRGLHLPVRRLNGAEIARLARGLLERVPAGLEDRLYAESEGLPFIALEYLRGLNSADPDWALPGGVRDLLHRRLQAPGETARQLIGAISVVGRPCDFYLLQAVGGRSEMEIILGLEELLGAGLLSENGGMYEFTHQKLREVAYEEISQARRRLLHQRTAEGLIAAGHNRPEIGGALNRTEPGALAGLAAGHFLQAGQPGKAADLFRQAGEHARRLYANSEALAAFQAAISAGHPDLAGLHEACGDLYTLLGNYREAVASYQTASAFCEPDRLSNLMHKLGEVYHRQGDWEAARGHFRAALDSAGENGKPAWLTHLFADWSLTLYRSGQVESARDLAGRALEQAGLSGDPGALAQALNMQGILARSAGRLEEAGALLERSLEAAEKVEDISMRVAALNNLSRLLEERDRAAEAIPLARQALELCARMGDRHRQAALQNNLADLYHSAGMDAESMTELKRAVALFAEIGESAVPSQPEIWKLTEW